MNDYVVVDIETSGRMPWTGELLAVGIGRKVYRPDEGRAMVRLLLQRETTIVAHTNFDLRWLCLDGAMLGDRVTYHDTKVMAWMLDGTQELSLDALAARYLGYVPPKPIKIVGGRVMFRSHAGLVPIEEVPWEELEAYNASDIQTEGELYEHLRTRLQEHGLWEHFVTEEAPFSRLLIEMEVNGLPFDRDRAAEMLTQSTADAELLAAELIHETGAHDFNPGSHQQVSTFLYSDIWKAPVKFAIPRLVGMPAEEKLVKVQAFAAPGVTVLKVGRDYAYGEQQLDGMGLKPLKRKDPKTRQMVTTVSGKLLNMAYGKNPWVQAYVEWKRIEKLNGYLRDWIERDHAGRLHGRFDQAGTITGRLAGREPNLQQVSNGNEIRDLFRGDLVVGDYGGLEARLAAHFSNDPVMIDIFRNDRDLYGVIAADVFGGPATKDNPRRNIMKYAWLSSQYGAQGETLLQAMVIAAMQGKSDSEDVAIVRAFSPKQADDLVKQIQGVVPRMFRWRDEVIDEAKSLGYVTTIGGRRRHLADIGSADWSKMAKAERQAVNSKVQGSAADIVRRAMLEARKAVHPSVARICLQVHDEILWERGAQWHDDVFHELVSICERGTGFDLLVPLVFEAKIADSWAAKGGSVAAAVEQHLDSVE